MLRHLRFELRQHHPEHLITLEGVRNAMKRIPERMFDPEFRFEEPSGRLRTVTVHHITRILAKLTKDVTPVDGWFTDRRGRRIAHAWLAIPSRSYLIEVLPCELIADPFLVLINGSSTYFEAYQADEDAVDDLGSIDELDRQATQLLGLIQSIEAFLALP